MKFEVKPEIETENSTEREKIIEGARAERLILGLEVLKRLVKVGSLFVKLGAYTGLQAIDLSPLGNVKLGVERLAGKNSTGKELTEEEKVLHSLIVLSSTICYSLLTYGVYTGNVPMVLSSTIPYTVTNRLTFKLKGPQIKEDLKEFKRKLGESWRELLLECKGILDSYGKNNVEKLVKKVAESKKENDN